MSLHVCPGCGERLHEVLMARSVSLQWDGTKWIEKDVFSESIGCPNCHEELDRSILSEAGTPLPDGV